MKRKFEWDIYMARVSGGVLLTSIFLFWFISGFVDMTILSVEHIRLMLIISMIFLTMIFGFIFYPFEAKSK